MNISKDHFLAILSMDSYNRDYGASLAANIDNTTDGLGIKKGQLLGPAEITFRLEDVSSSFEPTSETAGFMPTFHTDVRQSDNGPLSA